MSPWLLQQHLELDPREGRLEFLRPLCCLLLVPARGGDSLSGVVAGVLGAVSSCVSSDTTCTHTLRDLSTLGVNTRYYG